MSRASRPDPDCEVILVRHAQSEWNASGLWQGQADPPLSAAGRAQVAALAEGLRLELRGDPVSALVCSDLARARETAKGLEEFLGMEARPDPGLRELDVGEWSGLNRDEIARRDPELLVRFESGESSARPPGGETRSEIRHRARWVVRRLVDADPWGRIVLVSHLGLIRALLPDVELGNAEFVRVSAADALTRRMRSDHDERSPSPGPL